MADLSGEPGELRMIVEIKRAATGKTETVELIGFVDPSRLHEHPKQENSDGR